MNTYFRVERLEAGKYQTSQISVFDEKTYNRHIWPNAPIAKREAFASAANLSLIMHEPCTVDLLGERYTVIVTKQNV